VDSIRLYGQAGELMMPPDVAEAFRALRFGATAPRGYGWEGAFAGPAAAVGGPSITQHVAISSFTPESRTGFAHKYILATTELTRKARALRRI
jgi:hypothetical protein